MPLPPLTHTGQPCPSPLPGPPRSSAGSGLEPDPRAKPAHAPETWALSLSGRILSPSLRSVLPPRAQALPCSGLEGSFAGGGRAELHEKRRPEGEGPAPLPDCAARLGVSAQHLRSRAPRPGSLRPSLGDRLDQRRGLGPRTGPHGGPLPVTASARRGLGTPLSSPSLVFPRNPRPPCCPWGSATLLCAPLTSQLACRLLREARPASALPPRVTAVAPFLPHVRLLDEGPRAGLGVSPSGTRGPSGDTERVNE